ncbi:MAG: hypothetical protein ABIN36_14940 [Ferruginibacter sp.]
MRNFKAAFFLSIGLIVSQFLFAQQKKAAKKEEIIPVTKFKAPKLQTAIGKYKDSVSVSVDEAIKLIGMPLKIQDSKQTEYSISSYQFLYKKRGVREEDETDQNSKPIPTTTISSDRFKVSPLPDLWVNIIREQVKQGEEFYFFDVIAKDTQGRVMYAPNLKIMIR